MRPMRLRSEIVARCLRLIGVALVLFVLQGCILPSKTIHSAVYHARILDAQTKQPIPKARVELRGGYYLTATSKSGAKGDFRVGPLHCWRLFLAVPFGEGRIPNECKHEMSDNSLFMLEVSRSGYEAARVLVPMHGTNWSYDFLVGNIVLHPKDQTHE